MPGNSMELELELHKLLEDMDHHSDQNLDKPMSLLLPLRRPQTPMELVLEEPPTSMLVM